MSIQNRLLFIYTSIYVVAFVLFATIVYLLPRNRIVAEIDADMLALSSEIQSGNVRVTRDGGLQIAVSNELINLETVSTFLIIVDPNGEILFYSDNLKNADFEGYLDPDGFQTDETFRQVYHGDTHLRVMTAPIVDRSSDPPVVAGYIQVGRLLDSVESFNRFLVIALFVGFAAATASLFLAVLLTPGSFKPLEDIASVARQITNADDLSRRVPDTGRTDEIGVLTRVINQTLERLDRLFRMQQRLLADVSHELRTPLTAIRGNLDLMRRMGDGDPESLEILQEEVERMTRLVGDLLLLARADAGELPLDRQRVDLDTIVFEVHRHAKLLASDVEVTVTAVDPVVVDGDPDRIKQMLLNLISNAIKYTPAGGDVSMRLSHTEGWAYIHVSDTGIGIPQEDLSYIFDRFYRVDKARNRGMGGTGLGLSIAKWIATAHGGDIDVTSQVGEGSTFIVTLPVMEKEELDASSDDEADSPRNGRRMLSGLRRRHDDPQKPKPQVENA